MKYTPKELKKQRNGFVFNSQDFLDTVLPTGWSEKRLLSVKNDIVGETNLLAQTLGNMKSLGLKNKKDVKETIKEFSKKYGSGLSDTEISKKLPHGQNLLKNRVENDLLYQNAENCCEKYKGRKFMWLPSDAKEARHEHMLRYGKIYEVGNSELPEDDNFPGKAFGCKCGYQWLSDKDVKKYSKKVKEPETYDPSFTWTPNIYKFIRTGKISQKLSLGEEIETVMPKEIRDSFDEFLYNYKLRDKIRYGEKLTKTEENIKKIVYDKNNYQKAGIRINLYRTGTFPKDVKDGDIVEFSQPIHSTRIKEVAENWGDGSGDFMRIILNPNSLVSYAYLYSNLSIPEGEVLIAPGFRAICRIINGKPTFIPTKLSGKAKKVHL